MCYPVFGDFYSKFSKTSQQGGENILRIDTSVDRNDKQGIIIHTSSIVFHEVTSKGANNHYVFDKLNNDTYSNFICILYLNTQNISN